MSIIIMKHKPDKEDIMIKVVCADRRNRESTAMKKEGNQ